MSVEIEAATQSASLRSNSSPDMPAEFAVRVNEDASSTFTVFKGRAEVSSEKGTLVVAPSHSVTVDRSGSLGAPREIPPPPVLVEPPDTALLDEAGEKVSERDGKFGAHGAAVYHRGRHHRGDWRPLFARDASMHSVNRCLRERGYDVIGWQSASIASASFTSRAVTPPASWLQSDSVTSE